MSGAANATWQPATANDPPLPLGGTASPAGAQSDVEALSRIGGGDADALGELYDRYCGLLMGLAMRYLGQRQEAEDVLHEVFLYVWRKARHYDSSRASVSTWLGMIVRSRCLDRLRSKNLRGRKHVEMQQTPGRGVSQDPDGFDSILTSQRASRVRQALDALPLPQRKVLELAYFRGLSQSEIAEETGAPLGTVKTRTLLAMRKLRRELAPEVGTLM